MISRSRSLFALLACAFALGGCVSTASYHTAEPIEEGSKEVGIALEGNTVLADETDEAESGFWFHQPRVNARYGLSENADLGVTAGDFGVGADVNFLLVDDETIAFSLSPYQGIQGYSGTGDIDDSYLMLTNYLGAHFDLKLDESATLTMAAKPGFFFTRSDDQDPLAEDPDNTEFNPMIGGSIGMKLDVGESGYVFPEINVKRAFASDDDFGMFASEPTLMKFGLGVGF